MCWTLYIVEDSPIKLGDPSFTWVNTCMRLVCVLLTINEKFTFTFLICLPLAWLWNELRLLYIAQVKLDLAAVAFLAAMKAIETHRKHPKKEFLKLSYII